MNAPPLELLASTATVAYWVRGLGIISRLRNEQLLQAPNYSVASPL